MKNVFYLSILIFFLGACVSTSVEKKQYAAEDLSEEQITEYNKKVTEEKRIICRNEKPLGSNIAERKCYTVAELNKRMQDDKNMLRRNQANQPGRSSD